MSSAQVMTLLLGPPEPLALRLRRTITSPSHGDGAAGAGGGGAPSEKTEITVTVVIERTAPRKSLWRERCQRLDAKINEILHAHPTNQVLRAPPSLGDTTPVDATTNSLSFDSSTGPLLDHDIVTKALTRRRRFLLHAARRNAFKQLRWGADVLGAKRTTNMFPPETLDTDDENKLLMQLAKLPSDFWGINQRPHASLDDQFHSHKDVRTVTIVTPRNDADENSATKTAEVPVGWTMSAHNMEVLSTVSFKQAGLWLEERHHEYDKLRIIGALGALPRGRALAHRPTTLAFQKSVRVMVRDADDAALDWGEDCDRHVLGAFCDALEHLPIRLLELSLRYSRVPEQASWKSNASHWLKQEGAADDAVYQIASALLENPHQKNTLRALTLNNIAFGSSKVMVDGEQLGDSAIGAINELFEQHAATLQFVDFSDNRLDANAISKLSLSTLRDENIKTDLMHYRQRGLRLLSLAGNPMEEAGIKLLAMSIQHLKKLKSLDLRRVLPPPEVVVNQREYKDIFHPDDKTFFLRSEPPQERLADPQFVLAMMSIFVERKVTKSKGRAPEPIAQGQPSEAIVELTKALPHRLVSLLLADNAMSSATMFELGTQLSIMDKLARIDLSNTCRDVVGDAWVENKDDEAEHLAQQAQLKWHQRVRVTIKEKLSRTEKVKDKDVVSYKTTECGLRLRHVSMGGIHMGDKGVNLMSKALRRMPKLESLDMSNNDFGTRILRVMAIGLDGAHNLRHLDVSHNKIDVDGAVGLVHELQSKWRLQLLDVAENQFAKDGLTPSKPPTHDETRHTWYFVWIWLTRLYSTVVGFFMALQTIFFFFAPEGINKKIKGRQIIRIQVPRPKKTETDGASTDVLVRTFYLGMQRFRIEKNLTQKLLKQNLALIANQKATTKNSAKLSLRSALELFHALQTRRVSLFHEHIGRPDKRALLRVIKSYFNILASQRGNEKVFNVAQERLLLNLWNSDGETALHVAIKGGYVNDVGVLLGMGADPDAVNVNRETPMVYALKVHEFIKQSEKTQVLSEEEKEARRNSQSLIVDSLISSKATLTMAHHTIAATRWDDCNTKAGGGSKLLGAVAEEKQSDLELSATVLRSISATDTIKKGRNRIAKRVFIQNAVFYFLFLTILTVLGAYQASRFQLGTLDMKLTIEDVVGGEEFPDAQIKKTFEDIGNAEELWAFVNGPLVGALWAEDGGRTTKIVGSAYNRLVGKVRFRQVRVEPRTCNDKEFDKAGGEYKFLTNLYSAQNDNCYEEIRASNVAKTEFGLKEPWQVHTPVKSFQQRGKSSMRYPSGGFIMDVSNNGNKTQAVANITKLQSATNPWIDDGTRAVFVEFSVYNVNVHVLISARFVVEFLASGAVVPFTEVTSIELVEYRWATFVITLIMFCTVVVGVLDLFRLIMSFLLPAHLVSRGWVVINIISFMSLCVTLHRLFEVLREAGELRKQNFAADVFIETHDLAFITQELQNWFGVTILLYTLKGLRYIEDAPTFGPVASSIIGTFFAPGVIMFMAVFTLILWAFSVAFHVAFGSDVEGYRDLMHSFLTVLRTTFGDFSLEEMQQGHWGYGPVFFAIVLVVVCLLLLNILIAVISVEFEKILEASQERYQQRVTMHALRQIMVKTFLQKFRQPLPKSSAEFDPYPFAMEAFYRVGLFLDRLFPDFSNLVRAAASSMRAAREASELKKLERESAQAEEKKAADTPDDADTATDEATTFDDGTKKDDADQAAAAGDGPGGMMSGFEEVLSNLGGKNIAKSDDIQRVEKGIEDVEAKIMEAVGTRLENLERGVHDSISRNTRQQHALIHDLDQRTSQVSNQIGTILGHVEKLMEAEELRAAAKGKTVEDLIKENTALESKLRVSEEEHAESKTILDALVAEQQDSSQRLGAADTVRKRFAEIMTENNIKLEEQKGMIEELTAQLAEANKKLGENTTL